MAVLLDKFKLFDEVGYVPHSKGQESFHRSMARFRVAVCGRRYGKSTMAGKDVEGALFQKNRWFWIVGPTYDLGEKEFRVIWNDLIVKKQLGRDKRIKRSYNKRAGDMFIEFPWGTRLEVRSAQDPDRLVGEGLDGVIMSEAAKHNKETWERFIRPALADRRGWGIFPTTPEGQNWLYDLWMLGQNPQEPDYESWRFPSWENVAVYPEGREDAEIKLIERTTSRDWFLQEIAADFTAFVGRIFGEFAVETHCRSHVFNPAWKNYIFFDFGFVNPLAAIEVQVDPFDNVYIWREHYESYLRLDDHLSIMSSREQPDGYHIDLCTGDAADPEAIATVAQTFAPCIGMYEAKENWRQGIDLVKVFLKEYETGIEDEYGTPQYKPKLFVDYSCTNVIREFNNYKARPNVNSGTNEAGSNSVAVKQDDHAMDAIRYGLMHIFVLGATYGLSDTVNRSELNNAAPDTGWFTRDFESDGVRSDTSFHMGKDF